MNSTKAVVWVGCVVLNLAACAFKEPTVDTYRCTEEQPSCPDGLICSNGLCVANESDDAGSWPDTRVTDAAVDGSDAAVDGEPACIADEQRDCDSSAQGICKPGRQSCVFQRGAWSWTTCAPTIQPGERAELKGTDECTNELDDDCDGKVDGDDEDCQDCTSGQVLSCSTGEPGICSEGQKSCTTQNTWGACEALRSATVENCTGGLDEDCDGDTDAADPYCLDCGDGVKNPLEECDDEDFGTKTCANSGFDQGSLICRPPTDAAPCKINYSDCLICTAPTPPDGVEPDRIVDAADGNDSRAVEACIPYRTVNAALSGLSAGAVVWVAPGVYSAAATRDTFPISVPAGVSLIGSEATLGSGTRLQGDGSVVSGWRAVVVLGANSSISGFQLVSEYAGTNRSLAGIYSTARPARIANNRFNARNAGVYLHGAGGTPPTEITGNVFYSAYYGLYLYGLSTTNSPQPKIRNNTFSQHTSAAIYATRYTTLPDLGLDLASDPGGNNFVGGPGTHAIYHYAPTVVYAYGNIWPYSPPRCHNEDPPTSSYEIEVRQGKVNWGPGSGEACEP